MASFNLTIQCDSLKEFSSIASLLCGAAAVSPNGAVAPQPGTGQQQLGESQEDEIEAARNGDAEAEVKPKATRTRKSKADQAPAVPTQNPDGSPIPPTDEPLPQPTPGGTAAPPAESNPATQADVFGTSGEASSGAPAATAGDGAAATGEVDLPLLKTAMADLLKSKSAAFAMKTLEDATGCKSLSSGSPSVVEKAKDDPAIMQRTYDALVAAAKAA